MFFILRCAFWLSIVYASILSPGLFHGNVALNSAALGSKVAEASSTIAAASDLCRGRAAECLDNAARLTALLEKTLRYGDETGEGRSPAIARFDEALPEPAVAHRRPHKERLARAP